MREGYDRRMLNIAKIAKSVWYEIAQTTLERCWMQADKLPVFHSS